MNPRRLTAPAMAATLLAVLGGLSARPVASAAELAALAAPFDFVVTPLNSAPPMAHGDRTVAPELAHLRSWISAVGAAVGLTDADGNGRADDTCLVDPRDNSVRVAPVRGTGDRFAAVRLTPPGKPDPAVAPMGCVPTDLTGDGMTDFLVYYWGRSPVLFVRAGEGYQGRDLVEPAQHWNTTATVIADIDGDGNLDVLVGNYFPDGARILDRRADDDQRIQMQAGMARAGNAGINRLLLSRPGGPGRPPVFVDASTALPDRSARSWTLAFGLQDLTGDLLPEIYVANDFGPDDLLVNRSTPGRPVFERVEGRRDATTPKSKVLGHDSFKGMGVAFTYRGGQPLPTVLVSNITTAWGLQESNFAFVPEGSGEDLLQGRVPYRDRSEQLGLSRSGWAWDIKAVDFDADGADEILQATGYLQGDRWRWPELQELAMANDQVLAHPWAWPNFQPGDDLSGHQHNPLWTYAADLSPPRYVDLAPRLGLGSPWVSRGIAIGDIDGDGRPDAVIANQWQDSVVLLNRSRTAWPHTTIRLLRPGPRTGATPAIGAQVRAVTPGGAQLYAELQPSNGHAGSSAPELFFGTGSGADTAFALKWRTSGGVRRAAEIRLSPGIHTLLLDDDGTVRSIDDDKGR